MPGYIQELGTYPIQSYDNPEPVEFVIPYSFDYALGKWDTSRNRVYVSQIEVSEQDNAEVPESPSLYSVNNYMYGKEFINNLTKDEVDRINAINIKRWKSHRNMVNASHTIWGIILLPTLLGAYGVQVYNEECNTYHRPLIYNSDGTNCGKYLRKSNYQAKY